MFRNRSGLATLGFVITGYALTLSLCSEPALAQSTAALQGTVTDSSGAVVPGAKIIVRNQGTAQERTVESDSAGVYVVPSLPVGLYRVSVTASGMQSVAVTNVLLEVGQTVGQNFSLRVAS